MNADLAIVGGDVVRPERILSPGMVVMSGGRIAHCGGVEPLGGVPVPEAAGKIVAPGFVDLHVHGGDRICALGFVH